jgi:UDP:flavonoid glycosyltransferase YjiC (YdhE family)
MQTWGSRGDVRPFLALADGLQMSGHEVTLVITCVDSPRYNSYVSKSGVLVKAICSPVIPDIHKLTKVVKNISSELDPVKQLKKIITGLFLPVEKEMYEESKKLCLENDLVIGHYLHYPLHTAAEIYQKPYVSVSLAHTVLPTKHYPPPGFLNLGYFSNLFLWRILRLILNFTVKSYPDKLRRRLGLKPAKDFLTGVWTSDVLNLVAVSHTMCPRQSDWSEIHHVCGFLDIEGESSDEKIPADLEVFLNNGVAPVYMNFGSLMPPEIALQTKTIQLLAEAAKIAGCRAIIQAPLWEECNMKISSEIYFLKEASHSLVLPRCQAIVHHGGAGTSQSASLAGIPSIIIYHISEQEFWGRQLKRLGIASGVYSRKRITSQKLAKNLRILLNSTSIKNKAKEIGQLMKKENGVKSAVSIINS